MLRPLTPADFGALHEWNQDEAFCRAAGWTPNLTREAVNTCWERLLAAPERDFLRLGVESDSQLVGYADLAGIDHTSGAAEFGIAIGPSRNWGRGLGRAGGLRMLQHGFQELKLPCIRAEVHAPNLRSLALMKKLGFRQEGVGAEQRMYDGQLAEMIHTDSAKFPHSRKSTACASIPQRGVLSPSPVGRIEPVFHTGFNRSPYQFSLSNSEFESVR